VGDCPSEVLEEFLLENFTHIIFCRFSVQHDLKYPPKRKPDDSELT
jgi:hypothetical protein